MHPEPQTAQVLRSAGGMISAMDCTEFSVGTVEETLPSPALWMIFRRKRGSQTGRRVGHRAQRIRNPSRSASGKGQYPTRIGNIPAERAAERIVIGNVEK